MGWRWSLPLTYLRYHLVPMKGWEGGKEGGREGKVKGVDVLHFHPCGVFPFRNLATRVVNISAVLQFQLVRIRATLDSGHQIIANVYQVGSAVTFENDQVGIDVTCSRACVIEYLTVCHMCALTLDARIILVLAIMFNGNHV